MRCVHILLIFKIENYVHLREPLEKYWKSLLKNIQRKNITLVHESDVRHQPFDFVADVDLAPPDLRALLESHESLRRGSGPVLPVAIASTQAAWPVEPITMPVSRSMPELPWSPLPPMQLPSTVRRRRTPPPL